MSELVVFNFRPNNATRVVRGRALAGVLTVVALASSACVGDNPVMSGPIPTAAPPPPTETVETAVDSADESESVAGASQAADGDDAAVVSEEAASGEYPDVLSAEASQDSDGTWRFDVTLSSPYDSPDKYADAWRIRNVDGTEYGIRVLLHDHATEQPFTRSESGIDIPDDVDTVIIEGRDLIDGWGGATLEFPLPR